MRGLLGAAVVAVIAMTAFGAPAGAVTPASGGAESIDDHVWESMADFERGTFKGTRTDGHAMRLDAPIGTIERTEPGLGTTRTYEYGQWTSPVYEQGFDATELVASWNAATPPGTWLRVEARGRTVSGAATGWYVLGEWAEGDGDMHRTSVPGQGDTHATVSVDTLATRPGVALHSYQLRVTLYRQEGTRASPALRSVGAMTSQVPDRFDVPVSEPGVASGIELPVPRYAQNVHKGHFPEYGGGGEVWCSPTSTEMVVEYYGVGPDEDEMSWIPDDYVDPTVAHAARSTYDYAYEGTGNWPFNTAYAARYGLRGHVTRLHSLRDVERYILHGIPVITSQSFSRGELDGADYGTEGHIMVVTGFTESGDVVVNDPASNTNAGVRNVYPRAQFERVWQRTKRIDANGEVASGPGGVAYVITPPWIGEPSH